MRGRVGCLLLIALGGCAGRSSSKPDGSAAGRRDDPPLIAGTAGDVASEQPNSGGSAGHIQVAGSGSAGRTQEASGGSAGLGHSGDGGGPSAGSNGGGPSAGSNGGFAGDAPISAGAGGEGGREVVVDPWKGLLLDPGFQGVPANAWQLTPAAVLEPTAVTNAIDAGQVRANFCPQQGALVATQQVDAPSFSEAGPSALRVNWRAGQGGSNLQATLRGRGASFLQGAHLSGPTIGSPWTTARACLGETVYGPGLKLELTVLAGSTCWPENYALIDRVDFVSDPACPRPGEVFNGNFESADGWLSERCTANCTGVFLQHPNEIVDGIGPAGTRALRIAPNADELAVWVVGTISVPLSASLPNPRLRMQIKGAVDSAPLAVSAARSEAIVKGTGAFESLGLCLFDSVAGAVSSVAFKLAGAGEFIVDDVTLESDAACASPFLIADGDFEQSGPVGAWQLFFEQSGPTLQIESNAAAAHSGNSYLHVRSTNECAYRRAQTAIAVPPPTIGAGPALHFFYRQPPPETSGHYVVDLPGILYESIPLPVTDLWTQKIICLPPFAGVEGHVAFGRYLTNNGCDSQQPTGELFVDDITVTTDASCPSH